MYITREDIKLIGEIMDELPGASSFKLESDSSSGIGTVLKLIATTVYAGRPVEVKFEITGVEKW